MARKPDHIEEFIPYSRLVKKMSMWRSVVASRVEYAQHLIANQYNIDPDKVKSIFLRAWDKSTKDYPSPKFPRPSSTREFESFNNYILYLWEYYVNNKDNPEPPKEPPAPKAEDVPDVEDEKKDSKDKEDENPALVIVTSKEEDDDKDKKNEQDPSSQKTYEGVGGEDLIDEDIDPRILRLLGLEDVFDIDYDTYKTLLREKMMAGRMSGTSMSSEETELLTDEFKRVKKKVGRFKVRKKQGGNVGDAAPNIRAAKGFLTGTPPPPVPPAVPETAQGKGPSADDNIAAIRKTVESILGLMENQFSMMRKQLEDDRRRGERQKRKTREDNLESGIKKTVALARKVLAPVFNLLDRIVQFITSVLIGRALVKFMDWIADPANQKKLQSLGRFIKDWWPALLAAFVLFATPLGQLIRFVIGTIAKLTLTIVKKGMPALLNFIRKHPLAAAALAAGVGAGVAATQLGDNREKLAEGDPEIVKPGDDKTPGGSQLRNEEVMQRGVPAFAGGGRVTRYTGGGKMPSNRTQNSSAGKITTSTGKRIRGAGKDTQLVAAQPGEIVISKKAVDKFGAPFFLNLNKLGGGTNIPKYSRFSDIQFAQGGGQVGVSINDGLERLSLSDLYKMLDPTEPAARRPHVFRAAQEARERYSTATREERDRQVAMATIRATRMSPPKEESSRSSFSTASRGSGSTGSAVASKVSGRPSTLSAGATQTLDEKDTMEDIGPNNKPSSGSVAATPFVGSMLAVKTPEPNPTSSPAPALIGKGASGIEPPPPPEPGVEIIAATAKAGQKMSGTGAQPGGDREMDTDFDAYIQTESRVMMMSIYGITGVT